MNASLDGGALHTILVTVTLTLFLECNVCLQIQGPRLWSLTFCGIISRPILLPSADSRGGYGQLQSKVCAQSTG